MERKKEKSCLMCCGGAPQESLESYPSPREEKGQLIEGPPETGEKLETETGNVYTLRKMIGRGQFGAVYLADGTRRGDPQSRTFAVKIAPDETVILLHPPLHLVGVSIVIERERQQNDSLSTARSRRSRKSGGTRRGPGRSSR